MTRIGKTEISKGVLFFACFFLVLGCQIPVQAQEPTEPTESVQTPYEKHLDAVFKVLRANKKGLHWKLYIPESRIGQLSQPFRANNILETYVEGYDMELVDLSIEYFVELVKNPTIKEALGKLAESDKTELKMQLLYGKQDFHISGIDETYKPSAITIGSATICEWVEGTCYRCFYTNKTCILVPYDCKRRICHDDTKG